MSKLNFKTDNDGKLPYLLPIGIQYYNIISKRYAYSDTALDLVPTFNNIRLLAIILYIIINNIRISCAQQFYTYLYLCPI